MVAIAKEFRLGSDFPTIDRAEWQKEVEADLKGVPFAKRMFSHSYEGIELRALYTEEVFPTAGDPAGGDGRQLLARSGAHCPTCDTIRWGPPPFSATVTISCLTRVPHLLLWVRV